MARLYRAVSPAFWIGPTGKKIRAAGPIAQLLALYLITSTHGNMLGLYYLPLPYAAHEIGIPEDQVRSTMELLKGIGFCEYDEATEIVWVCEMAKFQIGEALKAEDKRVAGVRRECESLPVNPLLPRFLDRYAQSFHLQNPSPSGDPPKPHPSPSGDPPKPGAVTEAGTGTEQEHPSADLGSAKTDRYPQSFEVVWRKYPKRAGGNSKHEALKAWKARVKQGRGEDEILAGTKRYAAFVRATGKEGTEYVKQAATFFGPAEHFLESWTPPPEPRVIAGSTAAGDVPASAGYGR
jgi:hypothetical protein